MRSGLNRESLVVPGRVVAHVVVPFILEDGIGTGIPFNHLFEVGKGDVGFRCL